MMGAWMAYSLLVASLLLGGAWATERVMTLYQQPARFVWAGALLGSILIPAAALMIPSELPSVAPGGAPNGPPSGVALILSGIEARANDTDLAVDTLLAAGWLLASAVLVVRAVLSRMELSSKLLSSTRRQMGAAVVYMTSGLGPAVTGMFGGEVVLPHWLWRLGPRRRRLAVVHEREHLRAGDPWLLGVARLLVLLLPWNVPLWWGLHRLRLAVETDCDRRVLRTGVDLRAYGDLLLHVGGRRSSRMLGFASLVERTSNLERRIDQMTRSDSKLRGPKALLAVGMAVVAVAAACKSPAPATPSRTANAVDPGVCEGNCTVRVDNRLDTDIEVYLCVTEVCDPLGNVSVQGLETFELPERRWEYVQLHLRESPTHRFISLKCERQFRNGEALAVVEDPTLRERCW